MSDLVIFEETIVHCSNPHVVVGSKLFVVSSAQCSDHGELFAQIVTSYLQQFGFFNKSRCDLF